jgi:multidrug efflux pump subunit AcrA (membrane-fusion protein)
MAIAGIGVAIARPKAKAEDEKGKIKTAKAEVGDVQVRVTEVGSVEPQVKVDVKSVLSGKVVELLVREGDRVKRGEVLARVEPDVNQARDLAQVKNAVKETEIALSEAKATFAQPRADGAGPGVAGRPEARRAIARPLATTIRSTSTASSSGSGVPIGLAEAGRRSA